MNCFVFLVIEHQHHTLSIGGLSPPPREETKNAWLFLVGKWDENIYKRNKEHRKCHWLCNCKYHRHNAWSGFIWQWTRHGSIDTERWTHFHHNRTKHEIHIRPTTIEGTMNCIFEVLRNSEWQWNVTTNAMGICICVCCGYFWYRAYRICHHFYDRIGVNFGQTRKKPYDVQLYIYDPFEYSRQLQSADEIKTFTKSWYATIVYFIEILKKKKVENGRPQPQQ